MLLETWLTLLVLVVAAITSLTYLYLAIRKSSTMYFMFWFALVALGISRFLYFYSDRNAQIDYYRDFIAVGSLAFVLVALFMLIRDSKPEFARFPSAFTFLPLAILPFYPLLGDKAVLRELINIILQGGGLVVALLILSIRQVKVSGHIYVILGTLTLTAAYTFRWFLFTEFENRWISEISLAMGMMICAYGFVKQSTLIKEET